MDLSKFKNLKTPYILILIGPPLSGKSYLCSFIKDIDPDVFIISRDEILMEVYGSKDYDLAYQNVNQKKVDRILKDRLESANNEHKNTIIDMTNMTSKRRMTNLSYFDDDYFKLGVIFPILKDDEYERRNDQRIIEENKNLPMRIVKRMISNYQPIKPIEGFNKVITL